MNTSRHIRINDFLDRLDRHELAIRELTARVRAADDEGLRDRVESLRHKRDHAANQVLRLHTANDRSWEGALLVCQSSFSVLSVAIDGARRHLVRRCSSALRA